MNFGGRFEGLARRKMNEKWKDDKFELRDSIRTYHELWIILPQNPNSSGHVIWREKDTHVISLHFVLDLRPLAVFSTLPSSQISMKDLGFGWIVFRVPYSMRFDTFKMEKKQNRCRCGLDLRCVGIFSKIYWYFRTKSAKKIIMEMKVLLTPPIA